jgi:putative ABC transport system substrate-binding protein
MKRREFITLLGGAAAWPLAARAQQSERVRRIGVLLGSAETDLDSQAIMLALRNRLQELGWAEERNIQIVPRWGPVNDPSRVGAYADELVSLKPEVIFCRSTPAVAALLHATHVIPIIFMNANDPMGSGFVTSLARPGGNITGFVSFEPAIGGKWLELLREIAPAVARVALLYNPETHTGQHFQSIESASESLRMKLIRVPFRDAAGIDHGLDNFAREPNGGILVLPDISTVFHRDLIVRLAAQHRLPALYPFRQFVASGGLAYYGTDERDLAARTAEYIDRILKGENAAELPVQAPTKFALVVNMKTARTLGLDVPWFLQQRADEVIE